MEKEKSQSDENKKQKADDTPMQKSAKAEPSTEAADLTSNQKNEDNKSDISATHDEKASAAGKPVHEAKTKEPKSNGNKLNQIDISFGVPLQEKVFLTKHLSIILKSGISLPESLRIVSEQAHGKLRKILADVIDKVESGKALNVALADHKNVFNQFFINMIKVGEKSGTLDQSLSYLSDQLTKDAKLASKVKSASLYPSIVLITAVGVGGGVSYYILPKLTRLFTSFKAKLPLATKILLAISSSLQNYGFYWLAGAIAIVLFFWLILKIPAIRSAWQRITLYLPVIGRLNRSVNLARIALTIGTLMKSSIDVVEALGIAAEAISFLPYKKALTLISQEVRNGKTIEDGIKKADPGSRLFDPTTRAMIRVGEKTGSLYSSLLYIADFYEEDVDDLTKNMATILEPILLIMIAIVVAFVAIAIISPMYQILNYINK